MGTRTALKGGLMALAIVAASSLCSAQTQTVTGGQGGYFALPDLRPAPTFALTGDGNTRDESLKSWERTAGPVLYVGNARVILPAARER